jgi:hypothetical protein
MFECLTALATQSNVCIDRRSVDGASAVIDMAIGVALDESWKAVIATITAVAVPLGRSRGVKTEAIENVDPTDGVRRFTLLARDHGVFMMRLLQERRAVECHWEQANGNAWHGAYRIEPDGSWVGPIAARAASRRLTTPIDIARDIIDGWLTVVIPHR